MFADFFHGVWLEYKHDVWLEYRRSITLIFELHLLRWWHGTSRYARYQPLHARRQQHCLAGVPAVSAIRVWQ